MDSNKRVMSWLGEIILGCASPLLEACTAIFANNPKVVLSRFSVCDKSIIKLLISLSAKMRSNSLSKVQQSVSRTSPTSFSIKVCCDLADSNLPVCIFNNHLKSSRLHHLANQPVG